MRYCKEGSINFFFVGKFVFLKFWLDVYFYSEFECFVRNNGSYFMVFNIEFFLFEWDRVVIWMFDEDWVRWVKWMKD